MTTTTSKWPCIIGAMAASLTLFGTALAQQAPQGSSPGLQEVVVTAQRREQRSQDVPIAVTAITADQVAARSFDSLQDVALVTPGMVFQEAGQSAVARSAAIFIRGIGAIDFANTVEPGVGIYVDGIYLARATGAMLDLDDIERVEVLRGPQGTLFGRNTIGGAINITTAPPSRTLTGDIGVRLGEDHRRDVDVGLSGPIGDTVGARLAFSSRRIAGYVHDIATGGWLGSTNTDTARVSFRWAPADPFDLTLTGDYSRDRSVPARVLFGVNPNPASPLRTVALFRQLVDPTYADPSQPFGPDISRGTFPATNDGKFWGVSADINWRMTETVRTRLLLAHRGISSDATVDGDVQPAPFDPLRELEHEHETTAEWQLLGNALDRRLSWVGGLFYMTEQSNLLSDVSFGGTALFDALEALPGPSLPFLTTAPCPPLCVGGRGNPFNTIPALHLLQTRTVDAKNAAAYTQGTYKLTKQLGVTVGLRYSRDDKNSTLYQEDGNTGSVIVIPAPKVYKFFDYRAGLDWHVTDDAMLYVTTATGHKSGGINPRPLTRYGFKPFDPEKLTNYEVGWKTEWLDHRARLNGALFHYDYENVQVSTVVPVPGGTDIIIQNGGKARAWGAELEGEMQVARPLLLTASVSYLDWRWAQIDTAATRIPASATAPLSPPWTIAASARYTLASLIAGGDVTINAGAHWQDMTFLTPDGDRLLRQSGYTTADATIGWTSRNDAWNVAAYGRNLTNTQVKVAGTDVLSSFGFSVGSYSRGRELGVTLKYSLR